MTVENDIEQWEVKLLSLLLLKLKPEFVRISGSYRFNS